MVVKCPNCLTQYKINTSRVTKTLVQVKCPSCNKSVTLNLKKAAGVDDKESTNPRPTISAKDVLSESSIKRFGDVLTVTVQGKPETPRILIADEPRAFRDFLQKSLEELGCRVTVVDDGAAAQSMLEQERLPHIFLINVVLKQKLGFVLCEEIKATPRLQDIKVILIGAIFRIDRFRRDPTNLYGADDYIEEIIVKQDLQDRIRKLLGYEPSATMEKDPDLPMDVVEHARRLARIIVSDIIVYNQDRADDLILNDAFEKEMAGEIEEGKEYFLEKIPSDRQEVNEIYEQTVADFLRRRKRELLAKQELWD